ncbi:MAG: hypothetical protein K2M56_06330 [Muribaculaceae bacterium]|nr:hypothetical protein [Muribaculaceae bacterium]
MNELLEKNQKRITYFRTYGRRSSCSACDRSEAEFQIRQLEQTRRTLLTTLNTLDHG